MKRSFASLRMTMCAAVAISLALFIYLKTSNVFAFTADTIEYGVWFVAAQAVMQVVVFAVSRRKGTDAHVTAAGSILVAFGTALAFKYLGAPFLYEPFRSHKLYLYFFAIHGVLMLAAGARPSFKPPRWTIVYAGLAVLLTLVANPSGFQGAYPRWVQNARNAIFKGGDTLPFALARVGGDSFAQPVAVRRHPTDANSLLVVERVGRIKEMKLDGSAPARTLLDIQASIGALSDERGLSNAVAHPEFGAGKPYLYLTYTAQTGEQFTNRLSRFRVDGATIDPASELVMIDQDDRDALHNGGGLEFGPDGFLYVGVGDEGGFNDPHGNSQLIDRNLFSGILRLDVDERGGDVSQAPKRQPLNGRTTGYFVPKANPFLGVPDALGEFWAIGMRNPYRFSFDGQGRLWAADVGQNNFEEVNVVSGGDNLEWSYREGPAQNNDSKFVGKAPEPLIGKALAPLYFYRHSGANVCIIGGFVYTGTALPELTGKYVFADLAGEIYALSQNDDGEVTSVDLIAIATNAGFGISGIFPVGDDIYITLLGGLTAQDDGHLVKLVPRGSAGAIEASADRVVSIDEKYALYCARCHGLGGKPVGTLDGTEMARDFTDPAWQRAKTDEDLARVIMEGGAAVGLNPAMPPWKGVLNDAETKQMVEKIRRLAAP